MIELVLIPRQPGKDPVGATALLGQGCELEMNPDRTPRDGSQCTQSPPGLGRLPERVSPEMGRLEHAGQGMSQARHWPQTDHLGPLLC